MRGSRSTALGLAIVGALALSACGGDDGSATTDDAASTAETTEEAAPSENACTDALVAMLPEGVDPDSCWSVTDASNPVFVEGTAFTVVDDPAAVETGEPASNLVAFDASTGEQIWASDPLPGPISQLAATEVDGEPGIGVVVTETDEGDAVTESSEAWGYHAWPADVDEDTPTEAPVHLTAPTDETSSDRVVWTDQGLLAGNQLLRPGADAFEPVELDTDPILVGDYDLDESFIGVSGDALLSYVGGVAWQPGGPEDGETYRGWVARSADGSQIWDTVVGTPNEGDTLFGEGPIRLVAVVGDHVLTVIPTDETYASYQLEWLDAASGEAAQPTADDLAGSQPVGVSTDVMGNDLDALLSPDGKHLFLSWSTLALVVDVQSGEVTRVASDFEITSRAIDDTTVHAVTERGALTIDAATAAATPLGDWAHGFDVVAGDLGAFEVTDTTDTDRVVVARREG